MDRTTLTANLKPLERRGLLEVAVDPEDRRSRRLVLTNKGRRVLAEALPIWQRVHADIDQSLAPLDAGALRKGLRGLAG